VLEEPINESIQIVVPEVVVEHSDGDIQTPDVQYFTKPLS